MAPVEHENFSWPSGREIVDMIIRRCRKLGTTGLFSLRIALLLCLAGGLQMGCGGRLVELKQTPSLKIKSRSFSEGKIPRAYSCNGQETSPELSWSVPPKGTQSFALIATDKDSYFGFGSVFGYFVHWVLYNIPADERELPEGVAKQKELPDGSRQGLNGFDEIGYVGPCPPGHSSHRYVFDLYALNTKLNVAAGASEQQVVQAITGHVLASGELVAEFRH